MYCKKCGNLLGEYASFCSVCGEKVKRKTSTKLYIFLVIGVVVLIGGIGGSVFLKGMQ